MKGLPAIESVWQSEDGLAGLLRALALPLAFLYGAGVRSRNALHRLGWAPKEKLPRPVVSVGNLTVGGAGKTPTALWLASELGRRRYKVAILSRGYGRASRRALVLRPHGEGWPGSEEDGPALAGDEPWMIAALHGQWVGVAARRAQAAREVLAETEIDAFILDDGFQHRRLRRDLDLVLLGEPLNGSLLPAGPFREPVSALSRANAVLVTEAVEYWRRRLRGWIAPSNLFHGALEPEALISWERRKPPKAFPLSAMAGARVVAVSGVARADGFYRMLSDWEAQILRVFRFPDHHRYSQRDWQRVNQAAREADLVITTEKDLVKLRRFPFARDKLFGLRVAMRVERGEELLARVVAAIGRGAARAGLGEAPEPSGARGFEAR